MAEPVPPMTPAPKAPTAQELAENRKENLIAFAVVILVLAAVAFFIWRAVTAVPEVSERIAVPFGNAPTLGDAQAPVQIVVFSDFECPYCGEFARNAFPDVKTQFIDTGKARIAFRHFPLATHAYAYSAALASACAQDQGKFWEYHDILYAHQDNLAIADLQAYAGELGLDQERFNTCLADEERAFIVIGDRQIGLDSGVSGTPTFFFNGRKVAGALSAQQFAAEVAKEQAAS